MAKFRYEIDSNDYQVKAISPSMPDATGQDCECCPLCHFDMCRRHFNKLFGKDCVTHFLVRTSNRTELERIVVVND